MPNPPLTKARDQWKNCIISSSGSVLGKNNCWNRDTVQELCNAHVNNLQEGKGSLAIAYPKFERYHTGVKEARFVAGENLQLKFMPIELDGKTTTLEEFLADCLD